MPAVVSERARVWKLRRQIRTLADGYRRAAEQAGDDDDAMAAEWHSESEWPENELAEIESYKARRVAKRWLVDLPPFNDTGTYEWQDPRTGHSYIKPRALLRIRREIRSARREAVRWWIQVIVMPLIALTSSITALVALWLRLSH